MREITDIKCDLLSKNLFERTQQHGGCTKPLGNDRFVQKIISSIHHMEQKTLMKQVVSMIYTPGEDFFAAATFKGL